MPVQHSIETLAGVVKVSLDDANLIKDAELVFDTKLV